MFITSDFVVVITFEVEIKEILSASVNGTGTADGTSLFLIAGSMNDEGSKCF